MLHDSRALSHASLCRTVRSAPARARLTEPTPATAYDPSCIDAETAEKGDESSVEAAFAAAHSFGAPRLLDTKDVFTGTIDMKSITTYAPPARSRTEATAEATPTASISAFVMPAVPS